MAERTRLESQRLVTRQFSTICTRASLSAILFPVVASLAVIAAFSL